MLLFNNEGNQSFSLASSSPGVEGIPASLSSSGQLTDNNVIVMASSASSSSRDFDKFPSPQILLLRSEWLQQNISQMLNISSDNLTDLINNIQLQGATSTHSSQTSMTLLATLTVFYTLIFFAGILGNLITCIVISRNKFMHTATNFYLFNLAISDLILLLSGMPQDLYNLWYPYSYPFTDIPCVMESVLSETAANATVLTITAFTVERYIAICHPFRQHTMSKLSRAVKFIFAIWLTAFVLALPQAMQFSVVPEDGGIECTINNDFFAHVFAISGFIFFGGPMTAICVLYVLIGVKLKRSRLLQSMPRRCHDVNRGISAQTRVIRMLIAVAVAFFLCWAPFHAQRLMAVYGSLSGIDSDVFNTVFHILNLTSGVLYFLSTCINPLLYNIMSHKFREAFKVTLARHFLSNKYQSQHHNYSALLKQNGSLRLHHTTVNNNALEHYSSFRIMQLHCRDPSHHLSLQDSIRTTTTTTTINSTSSGGGSGGGSKYNHHHQSSVSNSCRSLSRYNRCAGSQSTLMGRDEVNNSSLPAVPVPSHQNHRLLQTQISQLSSMGDANSLLESEISNTGVRHCQSNCPLKKMRRQKSHDYHSEDAIIQAPSGSGTSNSKRLWRETHRHYASMPLHETEFYGKSLAPVAPLAPHIVNATLVATQPIKPINSVAELSLDRPTRSRLKLTRIVSRRQHDTLPLQINSKVELMTHPSKKKSSLKTLAKKFKWHSRKKVNRKRETIKCTNVTDHSLQLQFGEEPTTTALRKVIPTHKDINLVEVDLTTLNNSNMSVKESPNNL
ncbi:FMRFamide receptor-like isoform X1 [Glossina fuscipes]|uniref:FMRFamide receptor-like isoform X1 n=1 Tax=Glossina fuscipes TaxID=7396 RepID=A0A9C5ZM51_9MUSC|nr:FMRFamide receptor-like isoform X1 [Glossina fuscipes]XP_037899317.1 FMRFamide receptor-like isoform X1 [Glossina fuscipes]